MPRCSVYITVWAVTVTAWAGMITYPGWPVILREREGGGGQRELGPDKVKAREKLSKKIMFQSIFYQISSVVPWALYKQDKGYSSALL